MSGLGPESETAINNVLFADNFFMTEKAVKNIEKYGRITWARVKTEEKLIKKVQETKPKVIVSEYFPVNERIMDASEKLRGIGVWGVGYDHIDVKAASERGIYVFNTSGSNSESVAEHVFALILNLSRKLVQTDAFVREGGWISREETGLPNRLRAQDLLGKTIGIIGLGSIGSRVAKIANALQMGVVAYDPYITNERAKEKEVELIPLEKLLRKSDFVTIHVVLNEETRGFIGAKEFALMKPTAYLINASRGQVISEEDLIDALQKKRIAGAGLDVFSKEPIDPANPLLKFKEVIVTPHCAGNSQDALNATALIVSQEIVKILINETPKNAVNKSQLGDKGNMF